MKQKNLVLMVVAVGCGLVAAFLTAQMSARTTTSEQVEVYVAAKDLPVGTKLSRADLPKLVKTKKVSKEALPPAFIADMNELADKRLSRSIRADETFNPKDVTMGGVITLPPGMDMVSLQIGAPSAVAGFVGPGSRVDILATVRLQNRLIAFPLLVDMLVVAVDTQTQITDAGVFPTLNTVSFAVNRKQALLMSLAKTRGCTLELLLRNTEKLETDEKYKIDDVLALLQDEGNKSDVVGGPASKSDGESGSVPPKTEVKPTTPEPSPTPGEPMVKILVATETIPANTTITKDLFAKFVLKEYRKGDVEEAFSDLEPLLGKELKFGLAKNQWVTGALVGEPELKPSPERGVFNAPKPGAQEEPIKPVRPVTPAKPQHYVTIHTTSGSKVFRYEEVKPGEWRLMGEVSQDDLREKEPKAAESKPSEKPIS